jgi:CRISPR-associated protein Cas2
MLVIVVERVPPSVHGELTRWLLEPHTGVFVGDVSAGVRELLWDLVKEKLKGGAALLLQNADTEQGYLIRTAGDTRRAVVAFEGLQLIRVPRKPKRGQKDSAPAIPAE